jgi:predicted component of type VI protein secretion system
MWVGNPSPIRLLVLPVFAITASPTAAQSGGDAIMKAHLTVMSGRHRGQTIPITQSPFLIGRDPAAHLRPASQAIDKQHCAIVVKDGRATVQDFAKSTRLNERPIEGAAELTDGDCLQIGPLAFRFCIDRTAAARETSPPAATDPDEDAAAALLLSMADKPARKPAAPIPPEVADDGGWGPTKATPPPPVSELSGTSLSAREILKSYRQPQKEEQAREEPPSRAGSICKRLEARPLHGVVQMPSIYMITETKPKHIIIHRQSGPRPPEGFKEVHTSMQEATHHLRGLHLGYHITVTDTGG